MEPYFFKWEESKYPLDDHSESHSGYIYISINAINIIPYGISTSVPMVIYASTDDYSADSLDTVYSLESFVTEKPDTSLDRDKPISQYIKFHCTSSKISANTSASITE